MMGDDSYRIMNELSNQPESEHCVCSQTAPGGAGGGPALAQAQPTGDAGSRSLNVTRPALISGGEVEYRVLLAGIDTLDFGIYVEFDTSWPKIARKLAQLKAQARGTTGRIIDGGRCAVLPGGKPNYQFHLQYPGFHLYVSRKSRPDGDTPNVFVSLNSHFLWDQGERAAVVVVQKELSELAQGTIRECRMSRCDLAVDLLVPGGLTDGFIRDHAVSRAGEQRIVVKHSAMQTHYIGAPNSEISLRVYNKSIEILRSNKLWFLPLWGLVENANVWRFEFQVRRPMLDACQINSLEDLLTKRGELWRYLTESWFSLRLHDDENATRRTVHPLWGTLQGCAERLGPRGEPLRRVRCLPSTDSQCVMKQAASRLVGFAARERLSEFDDALMKLCEALRCEFQDRNFVEECQLKAIQLGINPKGDE